MRRRRLAAILLGAGAALLAAEAALRLTGFGAWRPKVWHSYGVHAIGTDYWLLQTARPPEAQWDGDPYGRLPPGARMRYELNEHGLRGPAPEPGQPCVLLVGDSFTFGEGVPHERTFAGIAGAALGRRTPPVAVVNCGITGYGTIEEAARLPLLLDQFTPRAVVVVFLPNDVMTLRETLGGADLILAPRDTSGWSRIVALARGALGRAEADRRSEDWYLASYTGERRENWDRTRTLLAGMRDRVAARGARFGLVFFPLLHDLGGARLAPIRDTVERGCKDLGVPFLDLTPVLAARPARDYWLHPTDHHPAALAHELAAGAITPFVEGLLR